MQKIILAVFITLISSSCMAFDYPSKKLCHTIFSNDVVARVKVIKSEDVFRKSDPMGAPDSKYFLNVIDVYRGKAESTISVISEMGKQNVVLEEGSEYIVFPSLYNGALQIYNEGGEASGALIYSRENELKIKTILKEKYSSIEIEVLNENWEYESGAVISILGDGFNKKVTIGDNGKVSVKVKPGFYQIIIPEYLGVTSYSADGMKRDPYDRKVNPQALAAGQCAQIQLQGKK